MTKLPQIKQTLTEQIDNCHLSYLKNLEKMLFQNFRNLICFTNFALQLHSY